MSGKRAGRRRANVPVRTGSRRHLISGPAKAVIGAIVLGVVGYFGLSYFGFIGADEYFGSGSGTVKVVIPEGATGDQIGETLEDAGVVKSAQGFYQELLGDDRASSIQPGTFQLHKRMSSKAALDALLDRSNRVEVTVVIPEGSRVGQIVEAITSSTDISEGDVEEALDSPEALGLPDAADGNPEGYLFPATYSVDEGMTALQLLKQMVDETKKVESELNLSERAAAVNLDEEQVLTVASILEYEARRDEDYPKVARVLYNRLNDDIPLQLDSTVSYVSKRKGDVWTTEAERSDPSEYNTYQHIGLPPGPIGSPGRKTIEAALNPADGDWLYFLADKEGVTHFSQTYEEHVAICHQIYGAQTEC